MTARSVSWPDTTGRPSPQGYGAEPIAIWLLGRHPYLAALLERADCVAPRPELSDTDVDEDEEPLPFDDWAWRPDLEALAFDFRLYDRWDLFDPVEPERPPPPKRAEQLIALTDNERCQLRLLAALAARGPELGIENAGLYSLDEAGRRVLADWLDAVRAEWAEPRWRQTGPRP